MTIGTVDIEVGTNGIDFSSDHHAFEYVAEPRVHSLSPSVLNTFTNAMVTVIGENFGNEGRSVTCRFGSAKAVSRANLADLKAVEGISAGLAQKVYDFFHDKG